MEILAFAGTVISKIFFHIKWDWDYQDHEFFSLLLLGTGTTWLLNGSYYTKKLDFCIDVHSTKGNCFHCEAWNFLSRQSDELLFIFHNVHVQASIPFSQAFFACWINCTKETFQFWGNKSPVFPTYHAVRLLASITYLSSNKIFSIRRKSKGCNSLPA